MDGLQRRNEQEQGDFPRVRVLGIPFARMTMLETVQWIASRIRAGDKLQIVTANPEIVMAAQKNGELFSLLQRVSLVTPDGIGVVWAAKTLGAPLPERVAGYDLLHELMKRANEEQWRVYLFGASADANEQAARKLQEQYPGARIVGRRDGYFREEDEPSIVADINEKKPHLLFVALGAPKQELWIARHWHELNVNAAMGVGGSFDVLAGLVKRAPLLWQKLNLEWLYRLLSQPSRWRRQLALPQFVWKVFTSSFFSKFLKDR
ncbi:WecB/TagA/CpsF family glycosyltransferase [Bacillaceae bacterium]